MIKITATLKGMTIAVTNMNAMLTFYHQVLGIEFSEQELFGRQLYTGKWGTLELLFCPADLAQNTAKQNRHQFDIVVPDLQHVIQLVTANGGSLMSEPVEKEGEWSVGVYDPDQNSMVIKQLK